MNAPRRFSQAIAEGDGISLLALVEGDADVGKIDNDRADAVLVSPADDALVERVRTATSLPLLAQFAGNPPADLERIDACLLPVDNDSEWLQKTYEQLRESLELAFWIENEDHLESALENFDPEIFVLAAPDLDGEEALEHVLDLLPDVPAGKLAIAELPISGRDDVSALERAGVDGVIVEAGRVSSVAAEEPPEV
jgi:indole-3-glycerol phosphate synthase